MLDVNDLYQELILDHGRNPRHKGCNHPVTHQHKGYNPICGDLVEIFACIDDKGHIQHISFDGKGCAISMAATSLLIERCQGRHISEAKTIIEAYWKMLKEEDLGADPQHADTLGKLEAMAGVKAFPARIKCATLASHTFQAALSQEAESLTIGE